MKLSSILCASLVALALSSTAAFAKQGDPISGIPIGLEGDPGSIVIVHGVTDRDGKINFGKLAPGKYVAVIDGKSLVAAVGRLAPSAHPGPQGTYQGTVTFTVTVTAEPAPASKLHKTGPGQVILLSSETPYRRDTALREGVRMKFTVPPAPAGSSTYDALGRIIFVGGTVKF